MKKIKRDISTMALEQAMEEEGCPVCRLVLRSEHRWLFSLLWEGVNSPEARDRLVSSWGLCYRHAWGMAWLERRELGGNLGTAIIYSDLSSRLLESCRRNMDMLTQVTVGVPCPVCIYLGQMERDYISSFIRLCAGGRFPNPLSARWFLCMPHFYRALGKAQGQDELYSSLVERQREGLEHFRKDGRLAGEIWSFLWGTKDVEAPLLQNNISASLPHCPLCAERAKGEKAWFNSILRKGMGVGRNVGVLRWLCPNHAWAAYSSGGAYSQRKRSLALAMLEGAAEELKGPKKFEEGARARPLLKRLLGREPETSEEQCPFCQEMIVKEAELARHFLGRTGYQGFQEEALCLCLPHAQLAMRVGEKSSVHLGPALLRWLEYVAFQLKEYIRKHDWRFRGEMGEEANSWRTAVGLFVGDWRPERG